jgi:hypothetical protein
MCEGTLLATACTIESGHLTPLSGGAGEGQVVSKEVGEEERGARGCEPGQSFSGLGPSLTNRLERRLY